MLNHLQLLRRLAKGVPALDQNGCAVHISQGRPDNLTTLWHLYSHSAQSS